MNPETLFVRHLWRCKDKHTHLCTSERTFDGSGKLREREMLRQVFALQTRREDKFPF